jgi:hypothetical protein
MRGGFTHGNGGGKKIRFDDCQRGSKHFVEEERRGERKREKVESSSNCDQCVNRDSYVAEAEQSGDSGVYEEPMKSVGPVTGRPARSGSQSKASDR